MKRDSAFITGRIIPDAKESPFVTFYVVDYLLGIERKEYARVDAEGRFQIKFFIRNTHQVNWRHGEGRSLGTLIISPGDSLSVVVTENGLNVSGKNAAATEDYYHMRTKQEWSDYYHALDTGYRLEPETYLEFRKAHYKNDLAFLDSYCQARDCSDLFRGWYVADAKVRYFRDLMAYSWKSNDYGLGSPVRLTGERKEKYNAAYLGEIDLDDSTYTMSKWYTFFLNGYGQKVEKQTPSHKARKEVYIVKLNALRDIISREVSLEVDKVSGNISVLDALLKNAYESTEPDSADLEIMWKLSERYETSLQRAMDKWNADRWVERISSIPHQNTRDLRFLNTFVRFIEQVPDLDYFYQRVYARMQNPSYREILTREYLKKREADSLVGYPEGILVLPTRYDESANKLLSDIVKANRNKVIVVDFWATWCAPCLDDFAAMRPIKEKNSPDSVCYVYLCSQSSRDLWLKQVRKYDVKGRHYFLSDLQYSEFRQRFDLKAFPSYIIVDSKGKIYRDIPLTDIRDEKRFMAMLRGIMARDN